MADLVECPTCGGFGDVADGAEVVTCPECNGTGLRKKPAKRKAKELRPKKWTKDGWRGND